MNIFQLLFSFKGRINTKTYWLSIVPLIIVINLIQYSVGKNIAGGMNYATGEYIVGNTYYYLGQILLFGYPMIAIYAKRFHDRNKSGWWQLICLIPIIGAIWMNIELGFFKGTEGLNRYDPEYVPNQKKHKNPLI